MRPAPLQSEGEALAQRLDEAGVEVEQMTYPSFTHGFFGMGAVVPTAKEAVSMAMGALTKALATAQGEPSARTKSGNLIATQVLADLLVPSSGIEGPGRLHQAADRSKACTS